MVTLFLVVLISSLILLWQHGTEAAKNTISENQGGNKDAEISPNWYGLKLQPWVLAPLNLSYGLIKNKLFKGVVVAKWHLFDKSSQLYWIIIMTIYPFIYPYILFQTELHLKNANYLYSACSNSTDVV